MSAGTVIARGLCKAYKRYGRKSDRILEWAGLGTRHALHWVLEDIEFRIAPGESVGVVGINGAGKSTLLKLIAGVMPFFLNQEAAQGQTFTAVYDFTDPGVEALTVRVAGGAAVVEPGRPETADLIFTESSEAFEKTLRGIQPFEEAMQTGAIQVSSMDRLMRFGQLFPIDL